MNNISKRGLRKRHIKTIMQNYDLYLMLIPGIAFLLLFKYTPLYGLVIAFKDFSLMNGSDVFEAIKNSEWVGLDNFTKLFAKKDFVQALINTLIISVSKIVFLFPIPILLAILINEIGNTVYKRGIQTLTYLPHFLSWIIVTGLFTSILGMDGVINNIITNLGFEPVRFFMDSEVFRKLLVFTDGWKASGWNTIIYLAAITSIDPQLYEAAKIDGAGKLRQVFSITLPSMLPTISLMFIMRMGYLLEAGFEQVLSMYNATVYSVGDILQTYVYRLGLGQLDFSMATAVGIFNSVVAFVLVITFNALSKKYLDRGIW